MTPLAVTAYTATTAAGVGNRALAEALREHRSPLRPNDFTAHPLETHIGRVDGIESLNWPEAHAAWDCRNNRLAWLGLQGDGFHDRVRAACARYGAERVGLVIGTSTSSILATEEAYARLDADGAFPPDLRRPRIHEPGSLVGFLSAVTGIAGPAVTVSTACSSSAKAFAQAERLMRLGVIDAAVVGGVDSLCGSVIFGFSCLELLSREPCRPFDVERAGLSLGEAAGFALLERESDGGPWLLGYGESCDAHHMSTPHPDGLGARLSIEAALASANLQPDAIDYLNLHGTASLKNDEVEARLVTTLFPSSTLAGSTKGLTGHTLGTAGIVESVVCLVSMAHGFRPGTVNTRTLDPVCGPPIRLAGDRQAVRVAMTESFGFGGSNCALVFGSRRRP